MHTVEIHIIEIGMVEIKIAEDILRGCMNNPLYDNHFFSSFLSYIQQRDSTVRIIWSLQCNFWSPIATWSKWYIADSHIAEMTDYRNSNSRNSTMFISATWLSAKSILTNTSSYPSIYSEQSRTSKIYLWRTSWMAGLLGFRRVPWAPYLSTWYLSFYFSTSKR
jgi:hypothetical protein